MDEQRLMKARTAKSPAELLALAKAEGMDMTEEQASALFARLNPPPGELSDGELSDVTGGGCSSRPAPKFKVGDHVTVGRDACGLWWGTKCPSQYWIVTKVIERGAMGYSVYLRCPNCGTETESSEHTLFLYDRSQG